MVGAVRYGSLGWGCMGDGLEQNDRQTGWLGIQLLLSSKSSGGGLLNSIHILGSQHGAHNGAFWSHGEHESAGREEAGRQGGTHHSSDGARRSSPAGIDHDQELHEAVVHGGRGWLHQEHVAPSYRLLQPSQVSAWVAQCPLLPETDLQPVEPREVLKAGAGR